MYLNPYVPGLQYAVGLVAYVHQQLGLPIAWTARAGHDHRRVHRRALNRFAGAHHVPWVDFTKGQRKDEVMHDHLAAFGAAGRTEGVLFSGPRAGETALFRTPTTK